jgi:hypothetical protein
LDADHGADHGAVHVDVAGGDERLDLSGEALDAAVDAERQAVVAGGEAAGDLGQLVGVVADDVEDGAEHLLLQEVGVGDLGEHGPK